MSTQSAKVQKFKGDLKRLAELIDASIATVQKKVCVDLFASVVRRTPVDTGRARAGWAFAVGRPTDFRPPPTRVSPTDRPGNGTPRDPQFSSAPTTPLEELSKVDGEQVAYIFNNVAYIPELENGHSQQAPNGMVKLALIAMQAEIAKAIREASEETPEA